MRSLSAVIVACAVAFPALAFAAISPNDGVFRLEKNPPAHVPAAHVAELYQVTAPIRQEQTVNCLKTTTDPANCTLMKVSCSAVPTAPWIQVFPQYIGVFSGAEFQLIVVTEGAVVAYVSTVAGGDLLNMQVAFRIPQTDLQIKAANNRLEADRIAGGPMVRTAFATAVDLFSACVQRPHPPK